MKIVIVGSKSFDSLEYNLDETFNQQGAFVFDCGYLLSSSVGTNKWLHAILIH